MIDEEAREEVIATICELDWGGKRYVSEHFSREALIACMNALGKQIPKKVIPSSGLYKQIRGDLYPVVCPTCKCGFTKDADYKHCPNCGQALDWEGTE